MMLLLSSSAGIGVCLRVMNGKSCLILTIAPGLGQALMASTVTRSSQRSPVTRIIGSSFLLPVIGKPTVCTVSGLAAIIGLRPSIIRATRTTCTSIQTASAGATTAGTSATLSVPFQNKNKGRCHPLWRSVKPRGCKALAQHPRPNLGEARKGRQSRQKCDDRMTYM